MVTEDHARQEAAIMADLARLAASAQAYPDIVHATLDLVERLVSSPLLCLSVQEFGEVGHYVRASNGVDAGWAPDAGRIIARAQEMMLLREDGRRPDTTPAGLWFDSFPARTRSGRTGALALGAADPLALTREEEQLMRRLAQQVVLVLDHALLLERIEQMQSTDDLTGVINHRRLLELLDYEMRRHRYTRRTLALLILDIEGLRQINQSYGRQYGNHILKKLAVLIQDVIRPIDVVARSGLDEFAVLLPETDGEEAQRVLEALQERLLAVEFAGGDVVLAAAVTHCNPGESSTPENLLRRGEQALLDAKRQQRGWSALLTSRS